MHEVATAYKLKIKLHFFEFSGVKYPKSGLGMRFFKALWEIKACHIFNFLNEVTAAQRLKKFLKRVFFWKMFEYLGLKPS